MKKIILISLLFFSYFSFSQETFKVGDTIYYNKETITNNKSIANYYSIIKNIKRISDDNIKFQMVGYIKDEKSSNYILYSDYITNYAESRIAEGFQRFYHKNGVKSSEGIIKKGVSVGIWKHWYDNGQQMDERIIPENIVLAKKHKNYTLKNFWDKNGKQTIINGNGSFVLRRDSLTTKGFYKNGVRHGKFSGLIKDRKYFNEYYSNGKMISGISWDINGKEYNYKQVFHSPRYKRGQKSIAKHIVKNFNIPKYAYDNKLEGKILITFRIKKDGNVDEIIITKGVCSESDNEAIRVIKLLDRWKPAKHRGQAVNIRYTLPIKYNL